MAGACCFCTDVDPLRWARDLKINGQPLEKLSSLNFFSLSPHSLILVSLFLFLSLAPLPRSLLFRTNENTNAQSFVIISAFPRRRETREKNYARGGYGDTKKSCDVKRVVGVNGEVCYRKSLLSYMRSLDEVDFHVARMKNTLVARGLLSVDISSGLPRNFVIRPTMYLVCLDVIKSMIPIARISSSK